MNNLKIYRNLLGSFLLFAIILISGCEEDACQGVDCGPNGVCFQGTCLCDRGYEGDDCDQISREELIGTYFGLKDCGTGTLDTLEVQILEGAGDLSTIIVTDFDDYNCETEQVFNLQGNADGNDALSFDFIGDCETTFEGSGTNFINIDTGDQTITINMTITYFDAVDSINVIESCAYTLRR